MKHLKSALMAIVAIFCITAVNAQTKKAKTVPHQHTIAYQCPMKCEGDKTYNKAGKCPKCGMDLKAVAKPTSVGAVYQCPIKCEGEKTYDKAGKCPKCNMNLAKVETQKDAPIHTEHNHN